MNSIISELNSTASELHKGEGVDWEMAIEADDFAPVRETLFNLAMKQAKESVQAVYPDLKLDFLEVEDEKEVEDPQSGSAHLGAEGQKTASAENEAVDQNPAKDGEKSPKKKDGDAVDTPFLMNDQFNSFLLNNLFEIQFCKLNTLNYFYYQTYLL